MPRADLSRFAIAGMALAATLVAPGHASAATVAVTEWMYNGDEFIEFTNLTAAAVDFTGWSFDDADRSPGAVDLSAFGLVAPGESVILAELDAVTFRANWSLAPTVKIIGGNSNNLGRGDEINLYDASDSLVDRLTYGDNVAAFAGSIRTLTASGNPVNLAVLAVDNVLGGKVPPDLAWVLAVAGDGYGSYVSGSGYSGNPGYFALAPAPVPLPAALPMMLGGLGVLAGLRRRA